MSDVNFENISKKTYQYGLINETKGIKLHGNLNFFVSLEEIYSSDYSHWEEQCVLNMIPEVTSFSSEKFIPQVFNLDIGELGISFTKGCYPGQEVVARMHYLGKPKRRLFRFTSKFEVCNGDSLDVADSTSLKSSGQVIRAVKDGKMFYFLGIFEVNYINDQIFLNKDKNKLVNLLHE